MTHREFVIREHDVGVVTGAAGGLGQALALALAERGVFVVLADVRPEPLEAVAGAVKARGAPGTAIIPVDVSDGQAMAACAREVFGQYGAVRVLFNNAGIRSASDEHTWEVTPESWDAVFDVNFRGIVNGITAFVPRMLEQGEPAHIVNTASISGFAPLGFLAPYVASKYAAVAVSEVLHKELESSEVGVSVLAPGVMTHRVGMYSDGGKRAELEAEVAERLGQTYPDGVETRSADEVAAEALRAVEERRLYVFTHPATLTRVRQRCSAILAAFDDGPALRNETTSDGGSDSWTSA